VLFRRIAASRLKQQPPKATMASKPPMIEI
jgi:hypothetical protein